MKKIVVGIMLLMAAYLSITVMAAAPSTQASNCLFYTETVEGEGGYSVCDDAQANFRTAFQTWGLQKVGYPISQRYERDGFVTQAFQKAIMQWRADSQSVVLVNIFDDLHNNNFDEVLLQTRQTPKQLPAGWDGEGLSFSEVVQKRQALLDERPALRAAYFASSDPLTFFGLPTSEVQNMGNHHAVRLQRAVLQEWIEDVPWAQAGEVTIANGGDIAKELGDLPVVALQPEEDSDSAADTGTTTATAIPTNSDVDGLDTSLFFDGALAEDISIQDCTLSDGTQTTCYQITIAGYPANHDVGPFCPETISDTAEDGGIWFDGNGVYDVDGPFILGLADLYNDSNWQLYDDDGNVNVTDTEEAFDAAARPNVDPAYQNHCVEGRMEWLENGEPVPTTVLIPTTPVNGASAIQARGNLGVTLNGVIMAAPAPVDAILGAYTIAAFDDCGGHINPFDGYHLHGARGCSEVGEAVDGETPIFAYALDGYPIHSPLDEADEAAAGLDECNGHTTEADGYHYHANPAEENAILSCFTGLTVGTGGPPPPPGGRAPQGPPQE